MISHLDELIAMDYNVAQNMLSKVNVYAQHMKRYDAAWEAGWHAVRTAAKDDATILNHLAWFIVDNRSLEQRDLDLAMAAATRANEIADGKNASILDTLAHVYYRKGDKAKAIATQKRAIENASTPREREQLQATLNRFETGQMPD